MVNVRKETNLKDRATIMDLISAWHKQYGYNKFTLRHDAHRKSWELSGWRWPPKKRRRKK